MAMWWSFLRWIPKEVMPTWSARNAAVYLTRRSWYTGRQVRLHHDSWDVALDSQQEDRRNNFIFKASCRKPGYRDRGGVRTACFFPRGIFDCAWNRSYTSKQLSCVQQRSDGSLVWHNTNRGHDPIAQCCSEKCRQYCV